jgi:dTDP-4-amino-4,6-dideoxygalactose transaminase
MLRFAIQVENRDLFIKEFYPFIRLETWFSKPLECRTNKFEAIGYKWGMCPNAENVCKRIVNFPTHPNVTKINLDKIEAKVSKLDWNQYRIKE